MTSYWLKVAFVLMLVSSCLGQDKVSSISEVLSKAHVSGSLVYWSPEPCGSWNDLHPPFPKTRGTNYTGSPRETLQEMFADDPKMRVTQEPGGMIRMIQTDVPTDVLGVKVSHISFHVSGSMAEMFTGPKMAMMIILSTPEVQAFGNEHNIRLFFSHRFPGSAGQERSAHGELDDVTVSQALDYILHTFPGYWIYGNCRNEGGGREAFFWFVENVPQSFVTYP